MSQPFPDEKHLQCMEVWGGNQAVSTAVAMPGIDAWIFSQPDAGAAGGGDVHYASSCAAGALTRMLIADVSGHGNAVSDIARRLRKLMQRHINQHEQTRFVRAMNQEFAGIAKLGIFATAIAMSYDAPVNRLEVCNAGHPPPLIYRLATRQWSYLEHTGAHSAENYPLGIDGVADYEQFNIPIAAGDLVLCYTDALPEARLNEQDRLEPQGLLTLIQAIDVDDPHKVIPTLMSKLNMLGKIDDDLTMLLFSPNGNRTHVPIADRMLAPFRVLRAIAQSFYLKTDL